MDQHTATASQFKAAFYRGTKRLASLKESINAVNILPVPNGNTGDNIHKTLLSSLREMRNETHFGILAQQCARGALFGASGASGIILANFLIGFSESIKDQETPGPDDILKAVSHGCLKAKSEIGKIADGSMLDIGAALYDNLSRKNAECRTMTEAVSLIRGTALHALEMIPPKNPLFADAGINDAGALGIFHFVDGVYGCSYAELPAYSTAGIGSASAMDGVGAKGVFYSVEFLMSNVEMPIAEIKKSLSDIGDPVLVAYERGDIVKVLVRTTDPKRIFDRSARFGKAAKIKVDDLVDEQRYFFSSLQPIEVHERTAV